MSVHVVLARNVHHGSSLGQSGQLAHMWQRLAVPSGFESHHVIKTLSAFCLTLSYR